MANINSIKLPDGVTYDIDGKTVNGFTVEKAVPSNAKFTDTNTKVTSVSNHYAPAEDTSAQLSADASGGSDATPGITQLVTGVDVKRDAKGHVVGLGVDSIKLPSYPTVGTAAAKNYTTSVTSGSADLVTSGAVYTAIANLPEPMIFKGTLGTGGTITTLPTASTSNEGFTYKVITAGTYASQAAKVGDLFISNGSAWVLVPSGDDTTTDTWRNIKINGTEKLGTGISSGAVDFVNGTNTTVSFNSTGSKVSINATDTKYTATTTSIGSASAGTAIAADDITAWSAGTAPSLTITDKSISIPQIAEKLSCSISGGVLTFTNEIVQHASTTVGSASDWSAGTTPSLSYTARSIPNISVTSKTVATGITAS